MQEKDKKENVLLVKKTKYFNYNNGKVKIKCEIANQGMAEGYKNLCDRKSKLAVKNVHT